MELDFLTWKLTEQIDDIKNNILEYSLLNPSCSVCFSDTETKQLINEQIRDISHKINDNTLFKGPCDKHYICKECLRKMVLNFENHPINERFSLVSCSYYTIDCFNTETLTSYYYNHTDIQKILTEQEYTIYLNYSSQFEFPDYETVICPNFFCKNKVLVHSEELNTYCYYNTLITCHFGCNVLFCYYCKKEFEQGEVICTDCYKYGHRDNPNCLNYYINKIPSNINSNNIQIMSNSIISSQDFDLCTRKIVTEEDYLYKQKEITLDIAFDYIKNTIDSNCDIILNIQCPICLNKFYKSEQCSSLKHCGIERCYSCGQIQKRYKKNGLGDHWSSTGNSGCPRFDTCKYWNSIVYCDFKCTEGICYDHYYLGDCKIIEHRAGIINISNERKQCIIYHFIKSLMKPLRINLLYKLKENDIKLNYNLLELSLDFIDIFPKYYYYYSPLCFLQDMEKYYNYQDLIYPWMIKE